MFSCACTTLAIGTRVILGNDGLHGVIVGHASCIQHETDDSGVDAREWAEDVGNPNGFYLVPMYVILLDSKYWQYTGTVAMGYVVEYAWCVEKEPNE